MLSWPVRLNVARLALTGDPVKIVSYLEAGRALDRGEGERIAEIIIRQVSQPLYEMQERIDAIAADVRGLTTRIEAMERGRYPETYWRDDDDRAG